MKRLVTICICAAILLLTAACSSTTKAPSEAQLQKDLIDNIDMAGISAKYLENVTGFEITKRQTTPEDKTDTVWVHLEAENSEVATSMYFIMSYGLYNDGWLLDSIVPDQTGYWSFTPLRGVDEAVLQNYLPNGATIISNEVDMVSGFQRIEYSYTESYPLCEVVYHQALTFYFGMEYYSSRTWDYAGMEDMGTYENWHIDGTWRYYESNDTGYVEALMVIQGFDPQGIAYDGDSSNDHFVISGSYSYHFESSYFFNPYDFEDNGPFSVTCYSAPWTGNENYPYVIYTSVVYLGAQDKVSVYRDRIVLNSSCEMTMIEPTQEPTSTWSLVNGTLTISGTGPLEDNDGYSPWYGDRDSITKAVIEDGITSIDFGAFSGCSRLTSINVSSGNPAYISVDGVLFSADQTLLHTYPSAKSASSYHIPTSVTSIGAFAFSRCDNLTSVTIPDSVASIEPGAFMYCNSLTSVTIPNSVTSIGEYAFSVCANLSGVTILNGVTSISSSAFFACDSLSSITIPDSVTTIEWGAFDSCISLTDVYYGGSEAQWNQIAIDGGNETLTSAAIHFNS